MTRLEQQIQEVLAEPAPTGKLGKTMTGIKKTLNVSSRIVGDAVNIGDNLGGLGVVEQVGGWLATGKAISGTLKTVAGIIPDSSDMKSADTDKKVAQVIDTYVLPSDKQELFELLQYTFNCVNSNNSTYGEQSIVSMKNLHKRVNDAFSIAAKRDDELLRLAKPYMPKKRFGLF